MIWLGLRVLWYDVSIIVCMAWCSMIFDDVTLFLNGADDDMIHRVDRTDCDLCEHVFGLGVWHLAGNYCVDFNAWRCENEKQRVLWPAGSDNELNGLWSVNILHSSTRGVLILFLENMNINLRMKVCQVFSALLNNDLLIMEESFLYQACRWLMVSGIILTQIIGGGDPSGSRT